MEAEQRALGAGRQRPPGANSGTGGPGAAPGPARPGGSAPTAPAAPPPRRPARGTPQTPPGLPPARAAGIARLLCMHRTIFTAL